MKNGHKLQPRINRWLSFLTHYGEIRGPRNGNLWPIGNSLRFCHTQKRISVLPNFLEHCVILVAIRRKPGNNGLIPP
jgi:hypothetical protein